MVATVKETGTAYSLEMEREEKRSGHGCDCKGVGTTYFLEEGKKRLIATVRGERQLTALEVERVGGQIMVAI
jgi:hypothetical protein